MHENTSGSSKQHYLFALLMFMSGLLIILIFLMVRSQADQTTTTLGVTNTAPTINAVHLSTSSSSGDLSQISVTDNANTTIYVWGDFTDVNGCAEVTNTPQGGIKAFLYNTTSTVGSTLDVNTSCTDGTDSADCYVSASSSPILQNNASDFCTFSGCAGGTDTDANYSCRFDVRHFATPAQSWAAKVLARDTNLVDLSESANSTSSLSTDTATLAALNAVDLGTGSFDYGALAAGETSVQENVTVANSGNSTIDFYFSGTDMTCSVGSGSIPVANIHVTSTQAGVPYADMDLVSSSPIAASPATQLVRRTAGAASTQSVYSRLFVPVSGVAGTCAGTLTIDVSA